MAFIYLDNAATTRPDPRVVEVMLPYLSERFGNPSSLHGLGQQARAAVEQARRHVAALIGAEPGTVYFTGSGTEADNLAILGAAAVAEGRRHVVTTRLEHPAVRKTLSHLESRGFEVTALPPGPDGVVPVDRFEAALREDTFLACVMHVNNEIGTLQPVGPMAEAARIRGALFLTDAVQSVGKVPVDVAALGVDFLALSAHKFHGPKGVGALYLRPGSTLRPSFFGGEQEKGYRPGTENVPGIVGLGEACRLAAESLPAFGEAVGGVRDRFEAELTRLCPWAVVNVREAPRSPHVSSVAFPGVHGDALVIALDIEGVAASAGSACHSGSVAPSAVLDAMGYPPEVLHGTVRFSFSRFSTVEEAARAAEVAARTAACMRDSLG